MFTKEFFEVFTQLIKSWQVIAVSVVIVLYLKIVSYVSRSYHRPKQKKAKKEKIKPEKAAPAPVETSEKDEANSGSDAELGIEEA